MKAWSPSALADFETCPKRYHATRIAKTYADGGGEAIQYGNEVHKAFELYLKDGKPFPFGMNHLEQIAAKFKPPKGSAADTHVEQKLAINSDFGPTGYFDKDVYLRVVIDYAVINNDKALIVDWKTGKRKTDNDQLGLMAAGMFAHAPQLQRIDSTFVWLKEKKPADMVSKVTYTRESIAQFWANILPRVEVFQKAFRNDEFPAQPGYLCKRYCPVKSCPYHGT